MAARKKKRSATPHLARKAAKKKAKWGGKREGAGRPKGTGQGPSPLSRRNRVAVMLSDRELRRAKRYAKTHRLPVSTALYVAAMDQLVAEGY